MQEYLTWGGFPLVCKETDADSKMVILSNIFDSAVLKDIVMRNKVASPVALEKVLEYLIANSSTTISGNGIAASLSDAGQPISSPLLPRYKPRLKTSCKPKIKHKIKHKRRIKHKPKIKRKPIIKRSNAVRQKNKPKPKNKSKSPISSPRKPYSPRVNASKPPFTSIENPVSVCPSMAK